MIRSCRVRGKFLKLSELLHELLEWNLLQIDTVVGWSFYTYNLLRVAAGYKLLASLLGFSSSRIAIEIVHFSNVVNFNLTSFSTLSQLFHHHFHFFITTDMRREREDEVKAGEMDKQDEICQPMIQGSNIREWKATLILRKQSEFSARFLVIIWQDSSYSIVVTSI